MGPDPREVNVRFFGFADEVPHTRVAVAVPSEASLGDVLESLFSAYGEHLRHRLFDQDGHLREDVKLVVGGDVIDRLDHRVERADTVFIISSFAGGSIDPLSFSQKGEG